ncbi:YHYH domain-containing protein [Sporosarcina sp. Te-1]|uniref:YHYH domain-containing protein n=1 Tax=Sporosarcina sp. Te-1 TaxID=2818390 RepID=UPI0035300BFD
MKKLLVVLSSLLLSLTIFSNHTSAHPGRTDSSGGHTCRTNCAKWGLETGEYHYHNGGGTSSKSTSNTSQSKPSYSQADINEGRTTGKSSGYEDGYNRNAKKSVADEGNEGCKKGYVAGYEAGYQEGLKKNTRRR